MIELYIIASVIIGLICTYFMSERYTDHLDYVSLFTTHLVLWPLMLIGWILMSVIENLKFKKRY